MVNKKISPIAYLGIAGFLIGAGYVISQTLLSPTQTSTSEPQLNSNAPPNITILGDTFSGYSTFRNNTFKEKNIRSGIDIQYRNEFDQAARAAALGKNADLIVTTLDQFLQHQPNGKIVGLIDKTVGADAVILNTKIYPQLKSLNDLAKLNNTQTPKIVYAANTPSEYLARVLDIKFEQFDLSDFEIIEVAESTEAYKILNTDPNVAIAVLWEPFVSQAKNDGNTVILSSKDVPSSIVDLMIASENILDEPATLNILLTNYYQHIESLIQNSTRLINQIAEDGNLSPPEARNVASGIDFFSSIESKQWMSSGSLTQRINATAGILNLTGNLNTLPENPAQLFSSQYLEQAVSNSERILASIESGDPKLADILRGDAPTTATAQSPETIQSASQVGTLSIQGDITFVAGSASLTPASQQTLDQFSTQLQDFNQTTTAINIVGHTSNTGDPGRNQTLSQQRAQVVADYLIAKGVKLQIVAEGKGSSIPLPGIPPESTKNQRTEIQLKRIGN